MPVTLVSFAERERLFTDSSNGNRLNEHRLISFGQRQYNPKCICGPFLIKQELSIDLTPYRWFHRPFDLKCKVVWVQSFVGCLRPTFFLKVYVLDNVY